MKIIFREDIERLGSLQRAMVANRLVARCLPGNGKVRGFVTKAGPAGGGLRGEYVEWEMQLEEHEGFDPRRSGMPGSRPFYHVVQPISTSDPRLQDRDCYEEIEFTCTNDFYRGITIGREIDVYVRGTRTRGIIWKTERLKDDLVRRDGPYWKITVRVPNDVVMGFRRSEEMSFSLNFKEETTMKIYEGVVVKLNEQKQFSEVVKVVTPFVAADEQAAKNAVLVDYAKENNLAGKDLTGFTVVVRNFQGI